MNKRVGCDPNAGAMDIQVANGLVADISSSYYRSAFNLDEVVIPCYFAGDCDL